MVQNKSALASFFHKVTTSSLLLAAGPSSSGWIASGGVRFS